METKKERKYLSCAETAKLLRVALKAKWPDVKFSVRSKTYAGGASIDISYTDGPPSDEVNKTAKLYEGASFDGMQDLKSYHDTMLTGPDGSMELVQFGANYVFVHRDYSDKYNRFTCGNIDLRKGEPDLKTQMKNLWRHQSAYPYIKANSMSGTDDEKMYQIFSECVIDAVAYVTKCFELQGYKVNQYKEDGREVFEVRAAK